MQVQRVQINKEQIQKIAKIIKDLPDADHGLNFYSFKIGNIEKVASDMYPEKNHPNTVDFFSLACLHQFGFWHGDEKGYQKPLIGYINGKESKGSDLLWKVLKRALDKNQEIFSPEHLANLNKEELTEGIFMDDKGTIPFQDIDKRLEITNSYGKYLLEKDTTPNKVVDFANSTSAPLKTFVNEFQKIPGFSQDPLAKKTLLLAMALANRPERFLEVTDEKNWEPILDYHLMRLGLRQGLVELSEQEGKVNQERKWTTEESEKEIRKAVYQAVQEIIEASGKPMPTVDHLMWLARKYCPEMTEPDCPKCIFSVPCKKKVELFQPVLRTIDY